MRSGREGEEPGRRNGEQVNSNQSPKIISCQSSVTSGEGLAVCEGGEGFVPCEPLPRDPHTQQSVRGAAEEESEESSFKSKPPRTEKKNNDLVSNTAANHQTSPDRYSLIALNCHNI